MARHVLLHRLYNIKAQHMNRNTPEIRQVMAFVSIIETGSFTHAAKKLNLTQSAISHSLRSLEEILETKLLVRRGKIHCLTDTGEVFLGHARVVVRELEKASRSIDRLEQKVS